MDRAVFQARLRTARRKKGISAEVASELCGLSPPMVSRYECGESVPKVSALCDLADIYGVSADFLLGRD